MLPAKRGGLKLKNAPRGNITLKGFLVDAFIGCNRRQERLRESGKNVLNPSINNYNSIHAVGGRRLRHPTVFPSLLLSGNQRRAVTRTEGEPNRSLRLNLPFVYTTCINYLEWIRVTLSQIVTIKTNLAFVIFFKKILADIVTHPLYCECASYTNLIW